MFSCQNVCSSESILGAMLEVTYIAIRKLNHQVIELCIDIEEIRTSDYGILGCNVSCKFSVSEKPAVSIFRT
jgi:hypothetical protein